MQFHYASSLDSRSRSDLLIIPFWEKKKKAVSVVPIGKLDSVVKEPIALDDFTGVHGTHVVLYSKGPEERLLLLGLGEEEELTVERLRRAYGSAVAFCHAKKVKTVALLMPKCAELSAEDVVRGVVDGLLLPNYRFDKHKTRVEKERRALIEGAILIGASSVAKRVVDELVTIAESVYLARDLVNDNADVVTPQFLVKTAKDLAKQHSALKVTAFDKKRIIKEKMGLIEAVSRSAACDPALIFIEYRGNPKSKEKTAIVGKGVTYDTGGLNLKTGKGMESMKCDMSGAAAVLGTMRALAKLKAKVNVIGVIPTTENSISADSYKPGDVYRSYSGITVEIGNTDAEGRLILADAIAYTVKNLKPTQLIDIATLTGSIVLALSDEAAGLMSNSDALADSLIRSGAVTCERVWRMPLYKDYVDLLKSDVADIQNVGGREAGSITAALFLEEFVGTLPWAHIDIAGTAFLDKAKRYLPKHATGFGVRLLVDFLKP